VFYFKFGIAPAPTGRIDMLVSPPKAITGSYLLDSVLTGDLEAFMSSAAHLVLPVITLAFVTGASIARMTYTSMRKVLASQFILVSHAYGVSPRAIVYKFALKNALVPVVTLIGLQVGFLIGGVVLVVVGCSLIVGTLIGSISGFLGGKVDNLIMRLMDMLLAFPSFVLALVFVAVFRPTLMTLMIALSIRFIPMYARLVRGEMLVERAKEYAVAARALGSAQMRLVFRHLLPNSLSPAHHAVHHEYLLGCPEYRRVEFFRSRHAAPHA